MALRRLEYLLLSACAAVYYLASGEWLSWILLMTVLGLPWLSLLLSLPAVFSFQMSPTGADVLEMGEEAELMLLGSCAFPMPPFRGTLRAAGIWSGKSWRCEQGKNFPTEHCGGYRVTVERARVCDYLGLFSFRVRRCRERTVLVRPRPQAVENLVDPSPMEKNTWVPKPGGGYSENHEHRLYRPGDSLNQLHWKLSAKVGDLILREPMEPVQGAMLLTVDLGGTPETLDRKLGRLRYIGNYLLERELKFEVRAFTGGGLQVAYVDSAESLLRAIDALLCTPLAVRESNRADDLGAEWQYHIGGDADDA